MKNVTLSIPDDLLKKSRSYAKEHQTTLNEMIRNLLRKTVNAKESDFLKKLESFQEELSIDTRIKFKRDDLYDR